MAANGCDFYEPLLDTAQAGHDGDDDNGHGRQRKWWDKVLDVDEAKKQILFSCPMILTNLFYYIITLVSVMFAGHLGNHQLAAATLANSWATVTGFAFMTGLSGSLETLCGQGYGAKLYRMLGINLQASCMISFVFSILVSVLWYFTDYVLVFLQQDPEISKTASLYMKYLIPGLFAYGFLQNILRFLQTQSILKPLTLLSSVAVVLHVGLTYALVNLTSLGFFKGAPLATSISLWIATIMLAMYVRLASRCKHTWEGLSSESFSFVLPNLRLAMPSAAMVCLEYWAFEILVFLAGLMPNAEKSTSIVAICVNTEAISYMISYGLSAAASTRVSNELGAGRPKQAKVAMLVTVKLSLLLALIMVVALAFGHNTWAGFFTSSPSILKEFASMTPFLAISLTIDSIQGVLSGAARGCGWQYVVVYVNLATFYFIGIAIASLLGFKLKLYAKGLWIGLICGLSCQATTLLLILLRKNWTRSELCTKKEQHDRAAVF